MGDAMHARGDRIGRYVVVDTVGSGAMGTVYAAYDPELARTVALKVVRPHAAMRVGEHALRIRLLREAQAMARVVHPNVVPIFDVGQQGDRLYLAMERIDGGNLRRWLARGRPSLRALLDVLVPAGRGLAAAHREGIVHRDFKPENVLVGARDRVCVTDFGLARPNVTPEASASMSGLLGVTMTLDGERIGTPAYMAPEQQRGAAAEPRSDLYAFCVVLYEGLYGRRPDEPAEPSATVVPRWLQRILARGLASDPEQRFASMDELLAEIDRHRRRGGTLLRAGAAVVTALAAAGLGLAALPGADAPTHACSEVTPDATWSASAQAHVRARFEQSDRPRAARSLRHVLRVLDDRVAASQVSQREVCEATWTRGEQSPELHDARMACLHDARARLRAAVGLLVEADAGVIDHAIALVDGLPPPNRCGALAGGAEPPIEADARERWASARDAIAKADAFRLAGRTRDALAIVRPIVGSVRELDRPALLGDLLVVLARLQHDIGDLDGARAAVDEALAVARLARRPALEAEAWIALAEVSRTANEDAGHVRFCARMALAAIAAAGGDPWLEARVVAPPATR